MKLTAPSSSFLLPRRFVAPPTYPSIQPVAPSGISSIYSWYRASEFDGTTDGTEITTWTDVGGAAHNLSADGGAGNRLTVARNFVNNQTAVFNNAKTGMSNGSYGGGNSWTVVTMIKFTETSMSTRRDFFSFNGSSRAFGISSGAWYLKFLHAHYASVAEYEVVNWTAPTDWHVVMISCNGSAITAYIDDMVTPLTWATTPGNPTNASYRVGYGESTFLGYMTELAIFTAVLTQAERVSLLAYLKLRYGLSSAGAPLRMGW